ncbi:MAG: DUF933 domain-containing protein, partial [bacterium]|nr:DUF933 domain-containing protein [bacterium]
LKALNPKVFKKAYVDVIDIAGLIKNAHMGEGLGNMFLSHIRACDGMIIVLRGFQAETVPNPSGSVDPIKDFEVLMTELRLADLQYLEKLKKKRGVELEKVIELENKIERGAFYVETDLDLLLSKKFFVIFNGDGDEGYFKKLNINSIKADLKLEYEIIKSQELDMYNELGIEPVRKIISNIIKKTFDLVTFYTIKNNELSSFIINKGSSYVHCANKIHTDIAKGFIKAEVVDVEVFLKNPDWIKLREAGLLKIKGKNEVINEDEVIEIHFSS